MTRPFLRRHKLANVEGFFVRDELRDNPDVHLVSVHKRLMPETEAYVADLIEHAPAMYTLLLSRAKAGDREAAALCAEIGGGV
jgi:hypothetical protein